MSSQISEQVYSLHWYSNEGTPKEKWFRTTSKERLARQLAGLRGAWVTECIDSLRVSLHTPPDDLAVLFSGGLRLIEIECLDEARAKHPAL